MKRTREQMAAAGGETAVLLFLLFLQFFFEDVTRGEMVQIPKFFPDNFSRALCYSIVLLLQFDTYPSPCYIIVVILGRIICFLPNAGTQETSGGGISFPPSGSSMRLGPHRLIFCCLSLSSPPPPPSLNPKI